ncbi:MAG TPA: hypothetical protein VG929_06260 [Actinomycetota bacterium]|nr:hypothetical protein [Actinomycetota bacterium]
MEAVLEWVLALSSAALAVLVYRIYASRRDEASRWAFLTFAVLGYVVFVGRILPDDPDAALLQMVEKLNIAILLCFPYFLFRLASTFRPVPKLVGAIALGTTAAIVIASLLVQLPDDGEPRSKTVELFILALLTQWVLLSGTAAVLFWNAGRGQPEVSRRRMRMLSLGAVALSVALVLAGEAGESPAVSVVIQLIALASVVSFFLAFAPPSWLRTIWRKPVEDSLRRAALDLMAAERAEDVLDVLLPHAIGIVGGEGVAVVDPGGKVIGSRGLEPADIARAGLPATVLARDRAASEGLVHLEFPFGAIVVRTSPTTPFFGQDEVDLLGALGALANLAMERVASGDLRVQLEKANLRRQQALEINDNIVQGLAVAKYSFDLGQTEKAHEAIEGTLVAARAIISELLEDLGSEMDFAPGTLTRGRAATGFMDTPAAPDAQEEQAGRGEA